MDLWSAFLARPESREDASYDTVRAVVQTLRKAAAGRETGGGAGEGEAAAASTEAPAGRKAAAPGAAAQKPRAGAKRASAH
jgi:hypothetical protein